MWPRRSMTSSSITGVILTKLDGDTRGGAALSVRSVTGKPIKFAGVGEKLEDLEVFHPDRMASRILGMGDVLTLIEEAQMKIDQKEAEKMSRKLLQNKLDFNDLLAQFAQVKKMGPIKNILNKFPGMEKQLKDVDIDDRDPRPHGGHDPFHDAGGARKAFADQSFPQAPHCRRLRHAGGGCEPPAQAA